MFCTRGPHLLSVVVTASLALSLLGATGCGDEQAEAERWIDEVVLVNGSFMETAAKGKRAIADARTVDDLSTAYSTYATNLKQQLTKFEEIEAPEACSDEQKSMERFMKDATEVADELADQENMTRSRLEQLELRGADAASRLLRVLKPALTEGTCSS